MPDKKTEDLEKRILALESQVSSQGENIRTLSSMSSISGFLTGLSSWQRFLIEADRQANLTVAVDPFPLPQPTETPCERDCWTTYILNLKLAKSTSDRLKVIDDYKICIANCSS